MDTSFYLHKTLLMRKMNEDINFSMQHQKKI